MGECENCGKPRGKGRHKYCSDKCQLEQNAIRRNSRDNGENDRSIDSAGLLRRLWVAA